MLRALSGPDGPEASGERRRPVGIPTFANVRRRGPRLLTLKYIGTKTGVNEKSPQLVLRAFSGPDGTRTRDPLRDRQVF